MPIKQDSSTELVSPELASRGLRPCGPIRSNSVVSAQQSGDEDTDDEDKGVYDSSHKKRVPSWYVCICMTRYAFIINGRQV
jgi:hypothetical protein